MKLIGLEPCKGSYRRKEMAYQGREKQTTTIGSDFIEIKSMDKDIIKYRTLFINQEN